MSKRASISVAVAVATLFALPTVSEASDCLGLHHMRAAADGTFTAVRHFGDRIVRVGDRMLGWIRCDHKI